MVGICKKDVCFYTAIVFISEQKYAFYDMPFYVYCQARKKTFNGICLVVICHERVVFGYLLLGTINSSPYQLAKQKCIERLAKSHANLPLGIEKMAKLKK
jgi:hypothetical protein